MYQGERDIAFIETFDEVFDPSLSASRGRLLMLSAQLVLVQQGSLQNSSMFPWCNVFNCKTLLMRPEWDGPKSHFQRRADGYKPASKMVVDASGPGGH